MIVVDTSAWVELLRRTESRVHRLLRRLIEERERLAVTEVVVAEVLVGATSSRHRDELRSMLLGFPVLTLKGLRGYEAAAELYRACQAGGETPRTLLDCLVAVPAIEARARVLHADQDFEKLARHTPLEVVSRDD